MTKSTREKVPKQMQFKSAEITALTDAFCDQYLNAEYVNIMTHRLFIYHRNNGTPTYNS